MKTTVSNPVMNKFGTFSGVFIPSILTILGVIMYLRMGWVVGNVGLNQTFFIVTISSLVTFITGLSISAMATNMKVGAGGAYYMISRSFGLEPGAAIGIPLFFAQAISIAFYITGFAESIQAVFPFVPMKIVGVLTLVLIFATVFYSTNIALKAQTFIFIIIVLSLISLFMGKPQEGFNISESVSLRRVGFWTVFAVFFPAVTGILSGVSMSGDLKNPRFSIPVGTIAAILVGYVIYMFIPWYLWNSASPLDLVEDSVIMKKISIFAPLIFLGIWGATLSSALGSLLAAPRTLMAMAQDKVLPKFLTKTNSDGVPTSATIISFALALVCIVAGEFNIIAPVLTMFFLTTYGVLNLISGMEAYIGNPTWRPTFRVHWLISLSGAICCLGIMLMINAGATYVALITTLVIYFYMKKRNLTASWSDIRPSLLLFRIRSLLYQLEDHDLDAKSWRPNIVSIAKNPLSELAHFQLTNSFAGSTGFKTIAITGSNQSDFELNKLSEFQDFLASKGIRSFVKGCDQGSIDQTALNFIKYYGIGTIKPNLYSVAFDESLEKVRDLVRLSFVVEKFRKNLIIVRNKNLSDLSEHLEYTKRPNINIWWGEKDDNNCHLMLSLALLMKENKLWKGAKISIKTLVRTKEDKIASEKLFDHLIQESRIKSVVHEVTKLSENEEKFEVIEKLSKDSSLNIIGIKSPADFNDISEDLYKNYLSELFDKTKALGLCIYILSEESIDLGELFVD